MNRGEFRKELIKRGGKKIRQQTLRVVTHSWSFGWLNYTEQHISQCAGVILAVLDSRYFIKIMRKMYKLLVTTLLRLQTYT